MGIFRQFPYTNFHEMNLDQILKILRELQDGWSETKAEWASYKDYIDNYFVNLDVSDEVLEALRVMASDGSLDQIMSPVIASETAEWLAEHITPTTPPVDTSLSIAGAAADAAVAGEKIGQLNVLADEYISTLKAVPERNIWSRVALNSNNGGYHESTTHIATQHIPIFHTAIVEVTVPATMEYKLLEYSGTTVSSYIGERIATTSKTLKLIIPGGHYIRVDVKYANDDEINTDAGYNVSIKYYVNNNDILTELNTNDITQLAGSKGITPAWESGNISSASGGTSASSTSIRTPYINVPTDMSMTITAPDNMLITVYGYNQASVGSYRGVITRNAYNFPVKFIAPRNSKIKMTAQYIDNREMSTADADNIEITYLDNASELNVLVIGNSFSMDSFAYLPPVLNELMPQYNINYGVCYHGSADIQQHIDMYNNSTPYTMYYEWTAHSTKWSHFTGGTDRAKTLAEIINRKEWDIIYVQPATNVTDPGYVVTNIIDPGRELLRILQNISTKQFTYIMGEWLGTDRDGDHGAAVFGLIAAALEQTNEALGINGYIPIGAAIQNARTVPDLQALGVTGNMLYDNQHMQSGIAPLIAAYTIAMYIMQITGNVNAGVYKSSFVPTTENCIAIDAWHEGTPTPMTHGESVGVTDDNIKLAQEIATMAIKFPTTITDCSSFVD